MKIITSVSLFSISCILSFTSFAGDLKCQKVKTSEGEFLYCPENQSIYRPVSKKRLDAIKSKNRLLEIMNDDYKHANTDSIQENSDSNHNGNGSISR